MSRITAEGVSATYRTAEAGRRLNVFGVKYRSLKALNNINLQFSTGDRVGVIGPNGSGKSTLLKVISGAMPPSQGKLDVEGETLSLLNRTAGLIQRASLLDNAYLKGASLGLAKKALRDFANESILEANLEHRKYHPLNSLSTGLTGRFNLAINARVVRPIMILDEWVGALDMAQIGQRGLLGRLAAESDIVIIASHNQALIERLCNKVVLLDKGKISYQGEDFRRAFIELNSLKSATPKTLPSRTNDESGPTTVHFIHGGKTGGYLVKKLLHNVRSDKYEFVLHGINVRLQDIPVGEKVILFVRDPIERYCRAFNNRLSQGGPFYSTPWSEREALAFGRFSDANELAECLSAENKEVQAQAFRAMGAINFVDHPFSEQLGNIEAIAERLDDVIFIGDADAMLDESKRMLRKFKLSDALVDEVNADTRRYFSSSFSSTLSEGAKLNLQAFYADEIRYLSKLKDLIFNHLCESIS